MNAEGTPRKLIYWIELPYIQLSPNTKCHYYTKASYFKQYLYDCKIILMKAMRDSGFVYPWEKVKVETLWHYGRSKERAFNGRVYRPRDFDNATASLKAFYDSIPAAGVVKDDSSKHLLSERPEFLLTRAEHKGRSGILVTIIDLGELKL